jgi:uncharacterized coiled-coil protein SlyX
VAEFREVVHLGLPLTQSRLRRRISMIMTRPDPGSRERFIRRAALEGITFSPDVKWTAFPRRPSLSFAAVGVGVLAATVIVVVYGSHYLGRTPHQLGPRNSTEAPQQVDHLIQQNSVLEATVSRLEHRLADQQHDTEGLRAQVAALTMAANSSRQDNEVGRAEATQSASLSSPPLEESEAQRKIHEKLLADTRAELVGLRRARASDQASIVADQIHINELSEQLKTAKANTSNMERQLVAAGGDARNLMGARQLHVVDVRDTDPNGKPGNAFGRIFLTEGKSLVFYAFDLNDPAKNDAKKTFQVWGQQAGKAGSLRSLGFLNVDNKAQRRWALKTDDLAAFKQIDTVFVTVEPQGGAKTPSSQRLLFAYLGEANHP